jgi:hypothetical protein
MIIYRFRPDMAFDCEVEVPDGTTAIPKYHTFQPPPEKPDHYALMRGGWILIEGERPPYPPIPTLDQLKQEKIQQLAERRWQAEESGTNFNQYRLPTDRITQAKLTAVYVKALENSQYTISNWKIDSTTFITLDADTIIAMANLVEQHVQNCFTNESVLSQQIVSATTREELDLVNLDQGWPE